MSALPYIPLYVADYLADTSHLSTIEHGAYLLLIMNYWQRGKPLPCSDLALSRITRLAFRDWTLVKPLIAPFFVEENGEWVHNRIEAELKNVRDKSAVKSKGGKASAASKAKQKSFMTATQTQQTVNTCSTPVEHNLNYTDTDTDTELRGEVERGREPLADLEIKLRDAAGWKSEPAPMLAVTGQIQALIDAGCDPDLDVFPIVKALAPKCDGRTSWNYFVKAIQRAHASRIEAQFPSSPPKFNGVSHGPSSSKPSILERYLADSQQRGASESLINSE